MPGIRSRPQLFLITSLWLPANGGVNVYAAFIHTMHEPTSANLAHYTKEYNVNDWAFLFALLAKSSSINSTEQVTVLCYKLIFFKFVLALRTQETPLQRMACWSLLIRMPANNFLSCLIIGW